MKAAFYESDITPPLGCYMSGSFKDRRAEDVYNKLYSKALVLEQDGQFVALISVDICEYPEEMHDLVTKRIFEYTGIAPECVCITATHTHHGAPVSDNPDINCFGDSSYKDVFFRLVADSAILAYKRLRESKILFGTTQVPGIGNCRTNLLKDGTIATHAPAEKIECKLAEPDHELPVIFIEQDGKKVGAFYAFGCHQDTAGTKPQGYTGDYSSIVSELLKQKYGSDFVSIYVPAPCGDVNHINQYEAPEHRKRYREIGALLAEGIIKTEADSVYIDGNLTVQKESLRIAKRKYDDEQFKEMVIKLAKMGTKGRIGNLVYYHRTDKTDFADLYVQLITIGDLAIYIYPGEIFSQYSHRTKKHSPFKYNMVVEMSNAHAGYIPTPDMFRPNSNLYETSLAYHSNLVPEAGEILYKNLMNMANKK